MMYRLAIASTVLALGACAGPHGPHHGHEGQKGMGMGMKDKTMSFFITSTNPGKGADLGGLAGADAHCAALAESAGVKGKSWKAYLSSSKENARDRIGKGPWVNAKGVVVATSVDNLHSDQNNLTKANSLDEKGMVVNGRGDAPNRHDVMTASNAQGMLEGGTCNDWTSSGEGSILGTLLGALLMTVVDNGCTKLELPNWVQEIATGGIILVAVILDRIRHRDR